MRFQAPALNDICSFLISLENGRKLWHCGVLGQSWPSTSGYSQSLMFRSLKSDTFWPLSPSYINGYTSPFVSPTVGSSNCSRISPVRIRERDLPYSSLSFPIFYDLASHLFWEMTDSHPASSSPPPSWSPTNHISGTHMLLPTSF